MIILIAFRTNAQTGSEKANEFDIATMEQKAQEAKTRSLLSGALNNYDLKYHRCEWEIKPDTNYIKGAITSYFKPTISGFNQLQFDLSTVLTVDSVKYHTITLLSYTQLTGDILQITFPGIIPINTLDSLTVYYRGSPKSSGFGSFVQTYHNGTPIIWTLSEPFGAKDWWPCKQNLVDKIDSVEVIVTTPQVNRVASNGLLISEITSGSNKIYHWKTNYPIAAYLVAIGVTNYAYYSDYVPLSSGNSLQVLNYVYPEDLTFAQSLTPDIINIIQFYDSLTIEYPFAKEKYGHAQFGWGGGMEHQTMTFVTSFNHPLLAHECAHQWFGDHITCGSWQDIWLNEGFATYFEGLTEKRFFPDTWMAWKQNKINSVTLAPNGSVLCDDTTIVSRVFNGALSYNKGAYLLYMLNLKLGDSLFFLSLKNYLNDPNLAYKYAHTPDLKAHFESTSGQNLNSFFNEWYYSKGYPSYQLFWQQIGSGVILKINQTQSDPSVSFYEMPVPVKFMGVGKDTTIVFAHTFSGQSFSSTINFPIIKVVFDPELHIYSANNSVTGIIDYSAIKDQITIYPNPIKNTISIAVRLMNPDELSFDVFDMAGKKVISEKENMINGISTEIIATESLAEGEYILKIIGKEINYSQKIVKKQLQ